LVLIIIACACIAVMTVYLLLIFENYDHSRWMIIPVWFLFTVILVLYLHSLLDRKEWIQDLVEYRNNEKLADLTKTRLESLLRIAQFKTESVQELLDYALEEAIGLTGSKIGYIYYYDSVLREFTLNSWSRSVMTECTIQEKKTKYHLKLTGIWGEAVRQAKPIILNDFQADHPLKKGYPDGHAHLYRYLTIPVFSDNQIVAVVGVANKDEDYDESDVRQLTLLMHSVWQISGRKKAEEALSESRSMMRLVLDTIPVRVFWKDRDLKYQGCNTLFAYDAGLTSPEEIVGKTDFEMGWVDQAEQYRQDDLAILESGEPKLNYEEAHRKPEGNKMWLRTSKIPLKSNDGKVIGIIGTYEDITSRKEAEVSLQKSAAEIHDLYNNAPCGYHSVDENGVYVLANDTELKWLGYTRKELVGKVKFSDILTPESSEIYCRNFPRFKEHGWARDVEFEMMRKDGTVIPVLLSSTAVKDSEGRFIMSRSTVFDISDRKQVEEVLRKNEMRLRSILDDLPLATVYTDEQGKIEFSNRVFHDLFGYSLEEIPTIEHWFLRAYPDPSYREEVMARWNADATKAKLEGNRIGPAEYHVTGRDSTVRICEITGTFLDAGVLAVFHDITDRRRSEEVIRQSEERLRVQFKGIPVPTYIWEYRDDDFRLIDYNDAALDFTRGRIAGFKDTSSKVFYEGKDWILNDMHRCLAEHISIKDNFWDVLKTTGEKKYMEVKYAYVPPNLVMIHMEDITHQKEAEEHLRYLSIHDSLTGLYNRFYADAEIERLKTSRKFPVGVIVVDIDGLKALNDNEGHAAGDQLIKNTAYVLKQTFRPEDMVARVGGDEFLVVLPSVDEKTLQHSFARLRVYLTNFNASGPDMPVSCSIGVSTAHSGDELEASIKQADMLMYQDKALKKGKNQAPSDAGHERSWDFNYPGPSGPFSTDPLP